MSMPLSQQAAELLGQRALVIITERVDDVALLIGQMVKMGWPEIVDRPSPRHWTQRGSSWGWTAVSWLASIVTEGDHRNVSVATYRKGLHLPLSHLTAQGIEPLDLRDDRLSPLLKHVRQPASGHQIAHDLHARRIEGYPWSQDVSRCAATTVSGDHEGTAGGRFQCGQSTDEPTRPQIQVMRGSLDPLGMPRATEVLSGARAEDGVYRPIIERLRTGWQTTGLVFVGAWKRRALDPRASLAKPQDCDWSPLPLPGATAEAMDAWITTGVRQGEVGE